jgi:hypothetical protein
VFSGPYALPSNGPAGEEGLTYSFSHENVFVVGLDQMPTDNREDWFQVNQGWLDAQLAANQLPHVFTFGHAAAFKYGHTDCLDDHPAKRDAFWNSLANAGSRVYFFGHDHTYARARIDDGDGNPNNDVRQILTFGGYADRSAREYDGDNSVFTPVSEVECGWGYGYLLVEVDGLEVTMTWKQWTAPGVFEARDQFSYSVDDSRPQPNLYQNEGRRSSNRATRECQPIPSYSTGEVLAVGWCVDVPSWRFVLLEGETNAPWGNRVSSDVAYLGAGTSCYFSAERLTSSEVDGTYTETFRVKDRDTGVVLAEDSIEYLVDTGGCPPLGDSEYCDPSVCGPCPAGKGNCAGDAECQGGLVCVVGVGDRYGLAPDVNVCEQPVSGCLAPLPLGHGDYCEPPGAGTPRFCGPCAAGEGDCDGDEQCEAGLECVNDVGASYGFAPDVDVCEQPSS